MNQEQTAKLREGCTSCPAMTEMIPEEMILNVMTNVGCPERVDLSECPSKHAAKALEMKNAPIDPKLNLCDQCKFERGTCAVRPADVKSNPETGNVFSCVLYDVQKAVLGSPLIKGLESIFGSGKIKAIKHGDIMGEDGEHDCEKCPLNGLCNGGDEGSVTAEAREAYVAPEFAETSDYARLKALFTEFGVPIDTDPAGDGDGHVLAVQVKKDNETTAGVLGAYAYYIFGNDGKFLKFGINN